MGKKIIILSRISTSPQDIEGQTKDLIRESERLGFDKDHQIIIESVESAIKLSEDERRGIQKMKYYIETDPNIDSVICWEPSRLSRRQKDLYSIRDYLKDRKIQLYVLNPYTKLLNEQRTDFDPNANVMFTLFATLAENEMMIKRERFQRAKKEMKERGQKFGGATIFGYIKNKEKKCVPHPIHSKIIVELFNHYITTDSSLYDTYVYASGVWPDIFPVREYKKAQRKIMHFFELEVYATGNWCYPPLITKEVWDKAHEKMSKARCSARYNCKRELLCRGKIYCGYCGRMMTGSGGRTKAYICPTDKLHSIQINWDIADWIMWEETRSVININSTFDITKRINEIQKELDAKTALKKQHEEKKLSLQQQAEKLLDIYLNNRINEELFNKRTDDINDHIRICDEYIDKLNIEISSYQNMIEDTKTNWNVKAINVDNIDDFPTRQEFVRKYIKRMVVERGEIPHSTHVYFEYTMPVIIPRSEYLYIYHNQDNLRIYRINEDGTEDLVYNGVSKAKRNKKTGRFEKREEE